MGRPRKNAVKDGNAVKVNATVKDNAVDTAVKKTAETKRDKFVRLAEARTNKIITMVQLLGNCANTAIYDYTQADVEQVFGAIEAELKEARKKFNKVDTGKTRRFSLK